MASHDEYGVQTGAILEGSDVVFPTRIMNEHLICSLCMGYLRDALTVTECLHTFCKPCIYQHFMEYLTCPTCECQLGPAPLEKTRSDRAMQNIVDKVFPHFAKEEAVAEKHLRREADAGNKKRAAQAQAESETKKKKVSAQLAQKKKKQEKDTLANKKLCLSLFPCDPNKLPRLQKPYLRSSIEANVKQYKNYLSGKLLAEHQQTVAAADIEILCKMKPLKNESTLAAVWKEHWNESEDLELYYQLKESKLLRAVARATAAAAGPHLADARNLAIANAVNGMGGCRLVTSATWCSLSRLPSPVKGSAVQGDRCVQAPPAISHVCLLPTQKADAPQQQCRRLWRRRSVVGGPA
eukprot:CAMPEP_0181325990 /NCGR_PEP_ID=MMETSP1101-20121128/21239_1 /TAXON_ID=46948 /ORGANISM="Rhodomonas abbreviata, Strain Caron Lab Isolate" /LENGTH=351 /DNA_ID=CAMNT_0023434373 /DNA_START=212 /DNA_END=1264 /DNA_ORIENTATION=+